MKRNKNIEIICNDNENRISNRKIYDFNYINDICFFIIKSTKNIFIDFVKKKTLKVPKINLGYRFIQIFELGDFFIYYNEGYIIIKTNIMCYEFYEVGNKYYEYDLEIKDFLSHFGINGSQPIMLTKNKFLKKFNNLSNLKCGVNNCENKCQISCKYCIKHLELEGLKKYLLTYINNNILLDYNNIIKKLNIK